MCCFFVPILTPKRAKHRVARTQTQAGAVAARAAGAGLSAAAPAELDACGGREAGAGGGLEVWGWGWRMEVGVPSCGPGLKEKIKRNPTNSDFEASPMGLSRGILQTWFPYG